MAAIEAAQRSGDVGRRPANVIAEHFKLIFLTAVGGTFFFMALCVTLHLITGGQPPKAVERLIDGMFDLVKVGFGAVVGLVAGKAR